MHFKHLTIHLSTVAPSSSSKRKKKKADPGWQGSRAGCGGRCRRPRSELVVRARRPRAENTLPPRRPGEGAAAGESRTRAFPLGRCVEAGLLAEAAAGSSRPQALGAKRHQCQGRRPSPSWEVAQAGLSPCAGRQSGERSLRSPTPPGVTREMSQGCLVLTGPSQGGLLVWFYQSTAVAVPQPGGLKPQLLVALQLEARGRDAGAVGRFLPRPLSLWCRWPPPPCVPTVVPLCPSVSPSLLMRTPVTWD